MSATDDEEALTIVVESAMIRGLDPAAVPDDVLLTFPRARAHRRSADRTAGGRHAAA